MDKLELLLRRLFPRVALMCSGLPDIPNRLSSSKHAYLYDRRLAPG